MESGGAQSIGSATALWSRGAGDGPPVEGGISAPALPSWVGDDGAPVEPKRMPSSTDLPPGRSRVGGLRASGTPIEDKRRAKSSGAQAVAASFRAPAPAPPPPPPPGQSKVSGCLDPVNENRWTKFGGARPAASSPALPSRQRGLSLRANANGALMVEKRMTKSADSSVAASSARQSRGTPIEDKSGSAEVAAGVLMGEKRMTKSNRVAFRADGTPKEEKGTTKSVGTSVAASSAPPPRQSKVALRADGTPKEEKGTTKSSSTQLATSSRALPPPPRRRGRVALLANGLPVDGVPRASVIEHYTHRDKSIYGSTDFLAKLYRLHDTTETGLEPMMRSEPTDYCSPNWSSCKIHEPSNMMQIFSLKLAYPPPAGDQVQLYGFMAVRDSLDPLRNYIFKRTRDDPLIVEQDYGLIQMSGPKRGIWWHDMNLVEFDMRIKRGEKEADDLQLIDGAVWFNDQTSTHARVAMQRIDGDYGSVDICYALLNSAMEATVQIDVAELLSGFRLYATTFYISGFVHKEMQLFDGVIPGPDGCEIYKLDKCVVGRGAQIDDAAHKYMVSSGGRRRYEPEKCAVAAGGSGQRHELGKYVIAFPKGTQLALKLMICQSGGSSDCDEVVRFCISSAMTHGSDTFAFDLGFATIHVKISWSTLPDCPSLV